MGSFCPVVDVHITTLTELYTFQAVGYGLVLLDGNLVNVNKLQKKLNLSRVDRLFRVCSVYDHVDVHIPNSL